MNRRTFIKRGMATAFITGATTLGYTFYWEPHWIQTVKQVMRIRGLPTALEGKSLVQLSDIHIGSRVSDDYLIRAFERVTALNPDFVVYTGDFVSYDDTRLDKFNSIMQHAPKGRMGTAAVLGNHDYGVGWSQLDVADAVTHQLTNLGIAILRNESATLSGLTIIGLEDYWSPLFDADSVKTLHSETPAHLLLCHNPDAVDHLKWGGYEGWILSGHTHGGQCRPPFLPAPILPVANKRYEAGEISLNDGRHLYINRGLGHLLKARFNVRPEITLFYLSQAL